ncbi:TadE/TadG family type IV pilus assembly protein [Seohaeicola saemankumensis]|uniref:TadE/TadG family type IV pilus assembly protein n=1 Tax=Seohaeicola saemankumensis TaxID=481181 RepID=A0ABW3TGF5_9RHOB
MNRKSALQRLRTFVSGTEGALFTETLIVVPVVTIFAVGILEFGNVFWQRSQVQVGVRDAARYMARCRAIAPYNTCTQDIARNLAFYGNPAGTGTPRVPGWDGVAPDDTSLVELEFFNLPTTAIPTPEIITVTGRHQYTGSPLFGLLQIDAFTFTYTHNQRYMGW